MDRTQQDPTPGPRRQSGEADRHAHQRRQAIAGLVAGCLLPLCALAQTEESFDVIVAPDDSQQQAVVLGDAAISTATLQLRSLQRILRDPRRLEDAASSDGAAIGAPGFAAALLAAGAAAGGDLSADFGRWNTFANLDFRFGKHAGSANTPAHDIERMGLLLGVDYRVNPDLVVGASVGYQSSNDEFTAIAGRAELDDWNLSGFTSWYPQPSWYIDGIVRVGFDDHETRRPVTGGVARGGTDGTGYSLSVSSGYIFSRGALTLTPLVRVNYTDTSIDGYQEDAPATALTYQDQDIESIMADLGATVTYAVNTNFGVVVPQATFEWVNEFEDEPRSIIARPTAGGLSFGIPVDAPDGGFYRAALGTTAILPHGRLLFFYYEALLSLTHKDVHTVTLGLRLEL